MLGITNLGFVRKTLQEIKADIEQKLQDIFGSDIDLTPSEPFGQIVAVLAEREDYIWQNLEVAYQSHKVDAVTGIIQDQLYRLNNITRLNATPTTTSAILIGDQGTVISAGSIVSNSTTTDQYSLNSQITISSANTSYLSLSVNTVSNTTLYRVTIDSINYDYTSDSDATESEILTGIKDAVDAAPGISAVLNNDDLTVEITIDTEAASSVSSNITINSVGTLGQFSAVEAGAKILPSLALDTIETPVSGWDDVKNMLPGLTGSDVETDEDFAIRRASSIGIGAENTIEALISNLSQVNGLTAVSIIENDTAIYDAVNDLDPQHLWVIAQGGSDQDIVDVIGTIKPGGIGLKGSESGSYIIPSTGQSKTIRFDRPTLVSPYIWAEITVDPAEYPADGDEDIKNAIKDYFDSNLDIGEDLLYSRIYTPLNSVPGHYVTKLIVSESVITGAEPGTPTNIDALADELISIDTARITVIES